MFISFCHTYTPVSTLLFPDQVRCSYRQLEFVTQGNKVMRAYKETLIKENDDNFSSKAKIAAKIPP